MDIKLITPPDRFVGFHGHTGFSVFDGLGYPSDHIDFVLENGMDAWALTDHGNGSGLAHAYKHAQHHDNATNMSTQLPCSTVHTRAIVSGSPNK